MALGDGFGIRKGGDSGASISGSGTNNYLARWTPDGSTLGNSLIQDDGTSLGVGDSPNSDYRLLIGGDGTINHRELIRLQETTTNTGDTYGIRILQDANNSASNKYGVSVSIDNGTTTAFGYHASISGSYSTLSAGITNDISNSNASSNVIGVYNSDLQSAGSGTIYSSFTDINNPTTGVVYGNYHKATYTGVNTATAVYGSNSELSSDGTSVVDNYFGHNSVYGETTNAETTNIYLFRGVGASNNATNLYGLYIDVSGTATNKYAVTLIDGTEANGYVLSSDANGNGSWADPSTLVDTIYTVDGTLANNRIVTHNGNDLTFDLHTGGNGSFIIDATSNTQNNSVQFNFNGGANPAYTRWSDNGQLTIRSQESGGALSVLDFSTASTVFEVERNGGGNWTGGTINLGAVGGGANGGIKIENGYNTRIFSQTGAVMANFRGGGGGRKITFFEGGFDSFLAIGSGSRIGTEHISLQGHTLIQGQGNTSATTALEIENIDGDTLLFMKDDGTFAIGNGASNTALNSVVIGTNSSSISLGTDVVIGAGASVTVSGNTGVAVAIGASSTVSGRTGTAVGHSSSAGNAGTSFGYGADSNSTGGTSVGASIDNNGVYSIALGNNLEVTANSDYSVTLVPRYGYNDGDNSVLIGHNKENYYDNTVSIGAGNSDKGGDIFAYKNGIRVFGNQRSPKPNVHFSTGNQGVHHYYPTLNTTLTQNNIKHYVEYDETSVCSSTASATASLDTQYSLDFGVNSVDVSVGDVLHIQGSSSAYQSIAVVTEISGSIVTLDKRLPNNNSFGNVYDINATTLADATIIKVSRFDFVNDGNFKTKGQIWSEQGSTITVTANAATFDGDIANGQPLDLASATGDITLTFTNLKAGGTYFIKVIQKASSPVDIGTWVVSGGNVKAPSGTAPNITTGASAEDTLVCYYDGTDVYVNYSQDYQNI